MAASLGSLFLAAVGAVGAILAAFLWCSRTYRHRPMLEDVPAFALCETHWGQACHPDLPTRWLSDFYEVLSQRTRLVASEAARPVVIHVGASTFGEDVSEYKPLLEAIGAQGPAPRLILVEPEQEHRENLLRVHARLGVEARDVTVVSGAMKKECEGDMVQYVFSDQMFLDFVPDDPRLRADFRSSLRSWRSFDRKRLGLALGGAARQVQGETSANAYDRWHTLFVPVLRKIYEAGNWTEYVVEESVPCMGAAELLRQADVRPQDIVMLMCDAEGFDVPIMEGFAELPRFRPSLVKFEVILANLPNRSSSLVRFFQSNGYILGKTQSGHGEDAVAYNGPRV